MIRYEEYYNARFANTKKIPEQEQTEEYKKWKEEQRKQGLVVSVGKNDTQEKVHKKVNRALRKDQLLNGEFEHIDEATEKPKSIDEQVINDLQIHFKPSSTFKGINNEVIKQKLGLNISDKKLKQLIKKAFKNIKIRGSNNYFLETI